MPELTEAQRAFADAADFDAPYFIALGRFVHAFARVEQAMQFVLRHYAKTTLGIGRAVFSGVKIDAISSHLNRLHDVGAIEETAWVDLDSVRNQIGAINKTRNDILHLGMQDIGQRRVITNALMALIPDRVTAYEVTPAMLDDMTWDLRKIFLHLRVNHMGVPLGMAPEPTTPDYAILRASWRYKRPQDPRLKFPRPLNPDGNKKRGRSSQPKPSRA